MQDNDIEMYLTHNEGKCIVAERFITTFKNKIYKYMTSMSKNLYIFNSGIKNENTLNHELAEELHKYITRKFKKQKNIIIFYRQYLGCSSCRYAIHQKI